MARECEISWIVVGQAAQAARDQELLDLVDGSRADLVVQSKWIETQLRAAAPQVLVVAQ
jgi:hypothetical protein